MQIDFKFSPLEEIKIIAYGLDFQATIIRCEWDGHIKTYHAYPLNAQQR